MSRIRRFPVTPRAPPSTLPPPFISYSYFDLAQRSIAAPRWLPRLLVTMLKMMGFNLVGVRGYRAVQLYLTEPLYLPTMIGAAMIGLDLVVLVDVTRPAKVDPRGFANRL